MKERGETGGGGLDSEADGRRPVRDKQTGREEAWRLVLAEKMTKFGDGQEIFKNRNEFDYFFQFDSISIIEIESKSNRFHDNRTITNNLTYWFT